MFRTDFHPDVINLPVTTEQVRISVDIFHLSLTRIGLHIGTGHFSE